MILLDNGGTLLRPSPHWAAYLIGKPYRKDAAGPDEFDCLGLVEYVFKQHKNIDLPVSAITLRDSGNEDKIREAARRSGLRPVFDGSNLADDLMLMDNADGPHIGMVIVSNFRLHLLHCVLGTGVCRSALADLPMLGYRNMRSWRLK